MTDTFAKSAPHGASPEPLSPSHLAAIDPEAALTITRNFQSAVFRLHGTITAMKLAAEADHEQADGPSLFWPDLIDALALLTPDAAVLDAVVDELRIPRLRDARDPSHAIAC
ncbi:MAG: hypothetical protein J0H69_09615 [Burkholderiales bacterium]|nr:hypothetical protein [Burkholderiales bacterium]